LPNPSVVWLIAVVRFSPLALQNRDASRSVVDRTLADGKRIGLVPGGIAEMFEGYPKPSALPNCEYAIVRKGFLKMAIKHGIPVVSQPRKISRLMFSYFTLDAVHLCVVYFIGLAHPFISSTSFAGSHAQPFSSQYTVSVQQKCFVG